MRGGAAAFDYDNDGLEDLVSLTDRIQIQIIIQTHHLYNDINRSLNYSCIPIINHDIGYI